MENSIQLLILFFGGLISGAFNSVAGGGTFIAFPLLLFTGVPSVLANVTCTMALFPGVISSAVAYVKDWPKTSRIPVGQLVIASVVGSTLGANVLIKTKDDAFSHMVPFLLMTGTVLFMLGPKLVNLLKKAPLPPTKTRAKLIFPILITTLQFIFAFYGGYFGGGVGILILSMLALCGMTSINQMNAYRTFLVICINSVAIIVFIFTSEILVTQTLVMGLGAIIGGYFGAKKARTLNPAYLRWIIASFSFSISIYLLLRR